MKTLIDYGIDVAGKHGVEVKTTCPQCSSSRKKKNYPCLNVNTEKGVWNCWHCGWSGTLQGGEWQKPEIRKVYSKPVFAPVEKPSEGLGAWFAKRGISAEVLQRNRISSGEAYFPQVEEERNCIMFPYYRGAEVVNVKYRTKDKLFRMSAGAERILYGVNDISTEALVWVEGEIDKLSVEMAGSMSCVSVPDGAPAPDSKSYSNKFDFLNEKILADVKYHIIAVDNDAPGVRLQEELVRRLGREKCLVVVWPEDCKDANEVLMTHGAEVLGDCIANARRLPIEGTYQVEDFRATLRDRFQYGAPKGTSSGWKGLDPFYNVMTGEWTLVTGIPGSGKSEWLDALTVNLARDHGWTFGIFSPENQPLEYHVDKIAEKFVGKSVEKGAADRMTDAEHEDAMDWVNDHYTFILPELPTVDGLLETAQALVLSRGIRGLVIDPWNEIDHSRAAAISETEHISQCLSKIRQFARNNGMHVWVVAHPRIMRKEEGKYPVPTPYDVAGSAHWRNKADNCITVHWDQVKGGETVQIHIQKVRKKQNGRIGLVELNYDKATGQYSSEPNYYPKIVDRKTREAA
ncbi:DnaB-like helicase C-terminal domain-containing protein [Paraburkholderia unamae]|uniref:Twinkle protein n=1 Tax=Paraburkholderia unamae TaxID=219649 RepID=A0ABX5KJH5_9BURK|nr:DnaB-like helicase C-terminal domain-containing protein [Paraburkholderia unamae]PVX77188.1 twinkle protein [Paraburkholderia unamae]